MSHKAHQEHQEVVGAVARRAPDIFALFPAATPNGLEGRPAVGRLYQAPKRLAGIRSPYSVDGLAVEVGCLLGQAHDYVVLVNHTGDAVSGTVAAGRGPGRAFRILPEVREAIDTDTEGWPFTLPGFSGALYEWRH